MSQRKQGQLLDSWLLVRGWQNYNAHCGDGLNLFLGLVAAHPFDFIWHSYFMLGFEDGIGRSSEGLFKGSVQGDSS